MRSHFKSHTLAEIFSDFYHAERSGMLGLKRGDVEKQICFDRGIIVFAESEAEDEGLGSVLVQQGGLSAGALAEAQRALGETWTAGELAETLVQRDLIAKSSVSQAMSKIVERVIRSTFGWDEGAASFREYSWNNTVFQTDILTTVQIILDGVSCMANFEPIHEAMLGLDNRLRLRDPMPIPVERLTLSSIHGFILSRVDNNTSVSKLLSILPHDEEEVAARFLFGLLVMGVIEYVPPLSTGPFRVMSIIRVHEDRRALGRVQEQSIERKYQQIREQNPHEILGVSPSATHEEIETAYEQIKAQYARDRLLAGVREKHRSRIALIESRLIEAFLTLTQPARVAKSRSSPAETMDTRTVRDLAVRVELDRPKSMLEADKANQVADSYFAKGRKFLRKGDFHNAIQYGKLAISHNSSDARYFCLLADCQVRNPGARWQRMAEENYTRATQLDPWNAEYWTNLGRLYKRRGMKLRARKKFEEALRLVPNTPEILEEIASLD